jgi:heat shock protein HslJ
MSKPFFALPLCAVLAACTPAAAPPQSAGDAPAPYSALGTEPGWTLDITPDRLAYAGDYGETKISVANPGARPSVNGERYVTDRLTVDITHRECSDGMSDRRYRDTVTLTADGKTVKGCGGGVLPPTTLAGTNWTFVSIGGVAVAPDQPTSLTFDGERLSGSAGCNRIMGGYASDGKTLTAGPLAATRMACHGPGMMQEQAFFALMAQPVSLHFNPEGQMVLTGEGGASAVLAPVI